MYTKSLSVFFKSFDIRSDQSVNDNIMLSLVGILHISLVLKFHFLILELHILFLSYCETESALFFYPAVTYMQLNSQG